MGSSRINSRQSSCASARAISTSCCSAAESAPTRASSASVAEPTPSSASARSGARLCAARRGKPAETPGFRAEYDVVRHAQVRTERELLVHAGDAAAAGGERAVRRVRGAVELERARVEWHDTREDLQQRALASAVLTEQGVHRARRELEAHVVEHTRAAEALCRRPARRAAARSVVQPLREVRFHERLHERVVLVLAIQDLSAGVRAGVDRLTVQVVDQRMDGELAHFEGVL